jgi:hypothetical protein
MLIEPVRNISIFVGCENTFINNNNKSKKNVNQVNSEEVIESNTSDSKGTEDFSIIKREEKNLLDIDPQENYHRDVSPEYSVSNYRINSGRTEFQKFKAINSAEIIVENFDETADQKYSLVPYGSNGVIPYKNEEIKFKIVKNYSTMWKDLINRTYHNDFKETGTRINLII